MLFAWFDVFVHFPALVYLEAPVGPPLRRGSTMKPR